MLRKIGGDAELTQQRHTDVEIGGAGLRIDRGLDAGEAPSRQLQVFQRDQLARGLAAESAAALRACAFPAASNFSFSASARLMSTCEPFPRSKVARTGALPGTLAGSVSTPCSVTSPSRTPRGSCARVTTAML